MKVLVTGGAGFLGAALVAALADRGDEVISIDTVSSSAARPGVTTLAVDISDSAALEAVFSAHRPDAIIHCAAIVVGVKPGSAGSSKIVRVNIEGSVNLFDAMVRFSVKRALHVSSEEIYGDFRSGSITEDHPLDPSAPYAITKSTVEQLGRHYSRTSGLEIINIRTSWVYGPGLPRDRIPKNLVEAALHGQTLHLPCGGDHLIDHTYVDDFVAGTLLLLDAPHLDHDTYHVASGQAVTVSELVDIVSTLAPAATISVGPGPLTSAEGRPLVRKGALDLSRTFDAVGYVPRFSPAQGMEEYLRRLRHQALDATTNDA